MKEVDWWSIDQIVSEVKEDQSKKQLWDLVMIDVSEAFENSVRTW